MYTTLTCTCGEEMHVGYWHRGETFKCPVCGNLVTGNESETPADAMARLDIRLRDWSRVLIALIIVIVALSGIGLLWILELNNEGDGKMTTA